MSNRATKRNHLTSMLFLLFGPGAAHIFTDGFLRSGDSVERIPFSRVAALLKGDIPKNAPWRRFQIIDSRFKMEFAGGHIRGAMNCEWFQENLVRLYSKLYSPDTLFIFHCEFSQRRGPTSASIMVQLHKQSKRRSEPLHIVIMDGGFASFYAWFPELCVGTYWPELRIDPTRPENAEFLRLAEKLVASRPESKDEF
jgi:M-phase inducer tyrosine phosphatase